MSATIHDILKDKYTMDYEFNYIGASTCRRSKASLSHMKKTQLAIIPIAELQKRDIDDYLLTLTKYSNSNIKKYFQQLKLGFSLACEQEIINKNIMLRSNIRCPKSDKPDKKVTGYTIEEQNKILKAIAAHKVPYGRNDYRNQLLLELYTGMRMGEINALTPDDIDFEKSIIHVSRTVSRGFKYEPFIKKGTKTYAGVSDIPLTKSAELVLKDAISKMPKNSHNLIFYDKNRREIMTTEKLCSSLQINLADLNVPNRGKRPKKQASRLLHCSQRACFKISNGMWHGFLREIGEWRAIDYPVQSA